MEDNDSVSISSEFSTTEESSTESPLVKRIALGSKSDTQETNGTQNGLIQSPPKEELGAFVIQLDTAYWQHELQILSAMSTNKDLKVSASGTLNGKRIIRPLDSNLWLQSCTCISQKPVKFVQLIKKSVVTAVMQNVHPFISIEALLADQRINTAERILSYNSSTRHGTNKVSKSYTKYENSTCRVAYQLYWEVLCLTLCYKTHSLLSVSTFWPCCCCMSCKGRTMQHVQWSSSYLAMPYKNAKLRNYQLKMCQLWRATFSKQQQMPSVTQQNAQKDDQCNNKLAYYINETCYTTLISHFCRVPCYTHNQQQQQIDIRKSVENRKQLYISCPYPKTSCHGCAYSHQSSHFQGGIKFFWCTAEHSETFLPI